MMKFIVILITLVCTCLVLMGSHAQQGSRHTEVQTFVSAKQLLQMDHNRQSEAWAMCSAIYDLSSEISQENAAMSRHLSEMGNGAQMAVAMILLGNVIETSKEAPSPSKFEAAWKYAQAAMTNFPYSAKARLLSLLEVADDKGKEEWFDTLSLSLSVCAKMSDMQQVYVDQWRALAQSGLLKLPD